MILNRIKQTHNEHFFLYKTEILHELKDISYLATVSLNVCLHI